MAFANLGKDRVRSLPLSQIMVNPAQPRTRFEDEALQQVGAKHCRQRTFAASNRAGSRAGQISVGSR